MSTDTAKQPHKLVGNSLYVESAGIIGRCTCGWTTGHRISSFIASNAFRDHQKENGYIMDEEQA